ncbi:MAG: hypothetical protein KGH66_02920 [Candidatus Micrarchaeota archaeon]|nr:hypothetical protein [Candidatus Micrarchaeota archaeon]
MHMKRHRHKHNLAKLKKWFDKVAYVSLAADIAIAAVTLVYLNTSSPNLLSLQLILNYVLTVIVVISLAILASIGALTLYMRLSHRGGRQAILA